MLIIVVVYANEALRYLKAPVFFLARFSLSLVCVSAKTGYITYYEWVNAAKAHRTRLTVSFFNVSVELSVALGFSVY